MKDENGEVQELEMREIECKRNVGQGEQFARLMLGRKLLLAERLKASPTDSTTKRELAKLKQEQKHEARE
eukprot:5408949-Pleurochrysis_carterae.AAC.1